MPSAQPLSLAECEQLLKTPAAGRGQGWRQRGELVRTGEHHRSSLEHRLGPRQQVNEGGQRLGSGCSARRDTPAPIQNHLDE